MIPASSSGATKLNNWTTDIPTQPGKYWFYGDVWAGQMGVDFTPGHKFTPRLRLVKVAQVSNGTIAHADGAFISLRKFDPTNNRSQGVVGYWHKCDVPELPVDALGLFSEPE